MSARVEVAFGSGAHLPTRECFVGATTGADVERLL